MIIFLKTAQSSDNIYEILLMPSRIVKEIVKKVLLKIFALAGIS